MPKLPKFRQLSPESVAERRALARVDESAIAQAQKALTTLTQGGAVKDLNGRAIRVRAVDVKALLEGRRFRFVASEAHYVNGSRMVVADSFVKAGAEAIVAHSQGRVVALNDALRGGGISLDEWAMGMQSAVKDGHIAQRALARGGFANLPPPVRERAEKDLFEQFNGNAKFPGLRAFAQDIQRGRYGTVQPSPALAARAQQYPASGRIAYEAEFAEVKAEAGFDEICRILAAVQHCPSCTEEAARGFVAQGDAVPIGDDLCGGSCKCTQVFRRSGQGTGANVQAAIDRAQRQVDIQRQIKAERMKEEL